MVQNMQFILSSRLEEAARVLGDDWPRLDRAEVPLRDWELDMMKEEDNSIPNTNAERRTVVG